MTITWICIIFVLGVLLGILLVSLLVTTRHEQNHARRLEKSIPFEDDVTTQARW